MISDLLVEAMRNIRSHWLRVLLTGSGIIWGIALFVALTAAGSATRAHYQEKMSAIGRKAIYTFPGSIPEPGGASRTVRRVELDFDDPPRLPGSPLIERSVPEIWLGPRVLKGGGHIKVVWTYGVGADTGRIRNFEVARGRFISAVDERARRRVLVIGAKVEQRLFGRRSALGQRVRLEGHLFRIIGVSVPKGQQMVNMGPNDDEQVLLPATTARVLFSGSDTISHLLYDPRTRAESYASTDRVRAILARHHYFQPGDEEALAFFNITEAMQLIEGIGIALQFFLGTCGLLTLLAGGIGVMNIMLVAVAERTRELGLRKAIGATNRDLFVQLLCETVVITLVAGASGVLLGAGIIYIMGGLQGTAERMDFLIPTITFSAELAALAFGVLVAVGIAAGIAPALRAARLDPAVALRDE